MKNWPILLQRCQKKRYERIYGILRYYHITCKYLFSKELCPAVNRVSSLIIEVYKIHFIVAICIPKAEEFPLNYILSIQSPICI